jgi:hypothetical protein
MTDIAERLRSVSLGEPMRPGWAAEAIDEIKRLRGALEYIASESCDEIGDYDHYSVTLSCLERQEDMETWCWPCYAKSFLGERDVRSDIRRKK